jgi:RHS repeat-associated protein
VRTVGDPVDVVSGANLDQTLDFRLPGPIPLEWRRYYNSAGSGAHRALGWGHTHEYDRCLIADLDGFRLVGPATTVGFPALAADGETAASDGLVLLRVGESRYQVHDDVRPAMEFDFRPLELSATLARLTLGKYSLEFRYSDEGRLETIVDSSGRAIVVETDSVGRIVSLTLLGNGGHTPDRGRTLIQYQYDAPGNLVQGTDGYGHAFQFRYDGANRMISKTDRRGYSFHFEYDSQGRCVQSRGEDGLHEVRLEYRAEARTTLVTKGDGGRWIYTYDENGTVTRIVDPYGGLEQFQLDESGRVIARLDPNGNATQVLYSDEGAPLSTRNILGGTCDFGAERPLTPISEIRSTVLYPRIACVSTFYAHPPKSWDELYRGATPIEWELGDVIAYADIELPTPEAAARAPIPAALRPGIRTAPVDTPRRHVERTPGEPISLKPEEYPPGESRYDLFGLLLSHVDPSGAKQEWHYDAGGNVVSYIDRDRSEWHYQHQSWNLLAKEADPLGGTLAYRYAYSERLAEAVDSLGEAAQYTYDLKDRLISCSGVRQEQYRYDKADNFVAKLDAQGNTLISCEPGAGGLPSSMRLASGENYRFSYDAKGQCTRATSDEVEVIVEYDDLDNRVSDMRNGLGARRRFDGVDLVEVRLFDRFRFQYAWNENDILIIEDPTGAKHRIRPIENGLVLRQFSNGTSEVAQYDWQGKCLLKASVNRSSDRLRQSLYSYSPDGHLLSTIDGELGTARYEYDSAHRLVAETRNAAHRFGYDLAGNLVEQPGLAGVQIVAGNRIASANGDSFEYDGRGRLRARSGSGGGVTYEYDALDRLTAVRRGDLEWNAEYDPLGRRIRVRNAGWETTFYWDGDRLAAEQDQSGRLRIYAYVDAEAIVPFMFLDYDSVEAKPESGRRFFVFTNQVGAPVRVEDDSGQAVWRARLEPYGGAAIQPGAGVEFHFRFPGHYFDKATGLHYTRFRYYNPELGRFLQPDPLDIEGGVNRYAYTADPLSQVDFNGLGCPKKILKDKKASKRMRRKAAALRDRIQKRLRRTKRVTSNGVKIRHDRDITVSVLVVRKKNGRHAIWVTSNRGGKNPPKIIKDLVPKGAWKETPSKERPRRTEPGRNHHAEQSGLEAADKDPTVKGVETIAPTRRCCNRDPDGCTQAIRDRGDPNLDSVVPPEGLNKSRPIEPPPSQSADAATAGAKGKG